MKTKVTIWYLEICDPADLRPRRVDDTDVRVVQACAASPEFSRYLYTAVGADLYWTEREHWSYGRWLNFLEKAGVETWVLWERGTPAGYAELVRQEDGSAKITYFGLLPQFVGRGYGGHLLTCAIERGFELGNGRVWVHTCSLDTPPALPNYQARGMRIFRERTFQRDLPEPPPEPWPGARRPGHHPRQRVKRRWFDLGRGG